MMTMSADASAVKRYVTSLPQTISRLGPGFLVCAIVSIAAQFLSDHYGAPAMLMALLLGIAFHFLAEEGRCVAGIDFTAKKVLRFGVALLGVRISVDLLLALGPGLIALLVMAIICTIAFGLLGARFLGRGWRLGLLTGGAVAICGASAAMAIAAVLPKNQFSERNLIFTILSVTVLSTMAMIAYPLITGTLGLDHRATGVFLGGTIHDVAQVVGAGFSVSEETGETATLIKLIRVTMLAPVVLVFSLAFRNMPSADADKSKRPPLVPGFVLGFLLLAALNSFGLLPQPVVSVASDVSRWALLFGIAAVGIKTALKNIFEVGREAVILIVAETVFLAVFILVGMHYLG
jgi:uncharacterized integral membrane protein (TIGR00698 family)